jgi:acyl-CoA reductase-like NAD-dependent aldehyde dehydrogenase
VLLELGGKCPAVIAPSANLDNAIKRIAWGKWSMNMGQYGARILNRIVLQLPKTVECHGFAPPFEALACV